LHIIKAYSNIYRIRDDRSPPERTEGMFDSRTGGPDISPVILAKLV